MTPTEGSRPEGAGKAQDVLSLQRKRFLPVPLRLVTALATLIGAGTVLLLLPWMTTQHIRFMDALFTATSASTVTGLTVLTTSTTFTRLGQWVILLLMELGGLGFLVVTVLTLRLLGRRISLVDRLAISSSLGLASPRAILQVLGRTVAFMLAVEGFGTLILWAHWRLSGMVPAEDAAFYALFHAVAAFCNAGFDLFSGSSRAPSGILSDPISLLTLGALVIVGGLGIPVYMEALHRRTARKEGKRLRRLSLQTRLALGSAVILIGIGWAGLPISESRHPGVLTNLPLGERVMQAWFQSVTGQLDTAGRLLIIATMFWGRLGVITIILALLKRGTRETLKQYPEETVLVG